MPLAPNTAPPCLLWNRVHNLEKVMQVPVLFKNPQGMFSDWYSLGAHKNGYLQSRINLRCNQKRKELSEF